MKESENLRFRKRHGAKVVEAGQENNDTLNLLNVSQESGLDSDFKSTVIHPFVISDKSGIGDFSTSYEDAVEPTDPGFGSYFDSFVHQVSIVENTCMFFDKVRGLNSSFIFGCQSCSYSCDLNYCNRGNINAGFFILNSSEHGFDNGMEPQLFSIDEVALPSSWGKNSFYQDSGVQSIITHGPYFRSRIPLINFVGSTSNTLSLSMSLFNSHKDNDLLCLSTLNSSIIKCNSLSTFINLFTIADSAMNITNEVEASEIYKGFDSRNRFESMPGTEVYGLPIGRARPEKAGCKYSGYRKKFVSRFWERNIPIAGKNLHPDSGKNSRPADFQFYSLHGSADRIDNPISRLRKRVADTKKGVKPKRNDRQKKG